MLVNMWFIVLREDEIAWMLSFLWSLPACVLWLF